MSISSAFQLHYHTISPLNMFAATLTLRRVWLQVAMKIKLMLLPQPTNCSWGWRILIPHEDIVGVITPVNILFRGGSEIWPLMKIKLMLLPQSTYCSEEVANFNVMMIMMRWCDDVMMWWCDDVMMWWCDDVMVWWCDDVMMWWCDDDDDGDDDDGDDDDDVMMWWCDDVMMMMMTMMMMIMIIMMMMMVMMVMMTMTMMMMMMTIVSVEQRPGWDEHVWPWYRSCFFKQDQYIFSPAPSHASGRCKSCPKRNICRVKICSPAPLDNLQAAPWPHFFSRETR